MTPTDRSQTVRTAGAGGTVALAVLLSGLLSACGAEQAEPDGSRVEGSAATGAPVTEPCPPDLVAGDLTGSVDLGSADVDGDGADDEVVMGSVPGAARDGARGGCAVALVVTTAGGTAAAPVDGASAAVRHRLLAAPAYAQIDGSAGAEIVVTTSWSPRGGGELGMFSWVGDGLVQVGHGDEPWGLFATVDDGGGTPQLLGCVDGGFTEVSAYPPGLGTGSTVTRYTLDAGALTVRDRDQDPAATWRQVKAEHPALPRGGVAVLPDCR